MSTENTYLAIFLASRDSARAKAWNALPEAERQAKHREGMAAWKAWAEKHQAAIASMGGPLGKTKRVSAEGIEDVSNQLGAFTVVRAESHEAAAKLFENHPSFAIFPGDSVEVMPILPIPGA
jgi:YCII-related domain